jgi:ubiquinone/menaquinone biosynthesis C-methylase UbiE
MTNGRKEIISKLDLKPSTKKILEVSPGPGVFQKLLRTTVGGEGRIVSLDLSMAMLRQCQAKNGNLNIYLVQGNAQYLPFANESFEGLTITLIFSRFAWHSLVFSSS